MNETFQAIGRSIPRGDGEEKARGEALFVDDLQRPGLLHGAILASPHAHARILSRDVSAALALPGVKAVLTGMDYPLKRTGSFIKDEVMLARDKVRYVGEAVAAVAARDVETARRATRLIEIEYEVLPAVLDIDQALADGAPILHEDFEGYFKTADSPARGNRFWRADIVEGDADAAWADCDVVVEGVYETQAQHHMYMEPCGALAEPDRGGRVTVWSACQSVHLTQQRVAEWIGVPMAKVRAVVPRIGGGFGGKGGPTVQPLAAALALKTGKPVKLVLGRTEDFEYMRSRHPARIRMKTGARRDGALIAREYQAVLDCGAYADESPAVISICALFGRGPYRIPNLKGRAEGVYTNKLRAGAFRGFGNPQISFAGESQIDEIAARLGMDPLALRRGNAMRPGDAFAGGQSVPSCAMAECLEKLGDAVAGAAPAPAPAPGRRRGVGYAAFAHPCGLLATGANVELRTDGSVAVNTGVVDIGQGSETILAQICAEALKLPIERVSFASPDTDSSPYNWKTAASRVTYMAGRAVLSAANQVRDKIFAAAAEMMECAAVDLELAPGGAVRLKGVPGRNLPFSAIAGRGQYLAGGPIAGAESLMFDGERMDPKRAVVEGFAFANLGVYTFGAQAAEVEIDEATGQVRVLRAWSAHDVGRAINPAMIEGQVEGGFVQGLGYALSEEMVWDDGRLANPSLMDYKVPGVHEAPSEIHTIIVEDPEPTGPFGAKGVGEPPLIGAAPAIANAIANAAGIRLRALPMTPERVLAALTAVDAGG